MDQKTPTPTEPPAPPPKPPASAAPSPSPPASAAAASHPPSSATLNPNPNPSPRPPTSVTQPQPQSAGAPPSMHRPWQHPISSPQQRGGVAIGVPAGPSPASFSSSFGTQFGGLGRGAVNVTDSMANTNSSQVRQGIQGVGMMGSVSPSSQLRPGGITLHHPPRSILSSLRGTSSSPSSQPPTTQNFQGHGFIRSSVGLSGTSAPNTSHSIQSQNQPWMSSASQAKPPLPSPSYRPQMSSPSMQQRSHIPQQHHSLPTTSQQQQMPSVQPQQSQLSRQPEEHYPSRVPQSSPHPQQLTRIQNSVNQKTSSLTAVQSNSAPPMQNKTAIVESDEIGNRILGKRTIRELVSQIDPSVRLDPEVEDILPDIAEDFVENITTFGCSLAKHRKSDTLEAKDILLHLERNWNMAFPGFGGDEIKIYRKPVTDDIHKERLAAIKKSIYVSEMANAKNPVVQAAGNPKGNLAKTSASTLVSPNLKFREVA